MFLNIEVYEEFEIDKYVFNNIEINTDVKLHTCIYMRAFFTYIMKLKPKTVNTASTSN